MEQPTAGGSQGQARPRGKMNYACEACRSSKVKCLTSPHPGICKRCADFKRECVFRTGPRTRRPKNPPPDAIIRPPPGPSKTFSIDFSMPADEDPADHFDLLREHHERILEDLVPSPEGEEGDGEGGGEIFSLDDLSRTPSSMTTASSSARSSRRQVPLGQLGIQPQFNLDSAERLLTTFRDTLLPHCPSVALPDGADVRSLARDMPFVLLAILAVTSCSTSLQGHSLYDEEFRKVLGLKFVTSSERSLEMLQGLLIYCSWYPFHLRPKNRQVIQYMGMAVDIVQDLELDQEGGYMSLDPQDQLPGIRAFLACRYSLSKVRALPYNSWVAHCWEVLEQSSALDGDQTLVWLVRLQHIADAADELGQSCVNSKSGSPTDHHQDLIRLGLEAQLREWQRAIPERFATAPSIFMASLFAEIFLAAAPLMRMPQSRNSKNNNKHQQASFSSLPSSPSSAVDANKLAAAMVPLRAFFDGVSALSPTQMLGLCGADRSRLIIALIVALRCSFPVPACPAFDWARAQRVLDLGSHLERLTAEPHEGEGHGQGQQGQQDEGRRIGDGERGAGGDGTGTGSGNKSKKKIDVCAAMRVVLRAVKVRYYRGVAASGATAAAASPEAEGGQGRVGARCPMLDGTLSQYLPMWEGQQVQGQGQGQGQGGFAGPCPTSSYDTLSSQSGSTGGGMATDPLADAADMPDFMMPMAMDHQEDPTGLSDKPPVPCDLWETMTMGWAADAADINLNGIGGAQYDGFEL
ncbi:hypothetical protein DL770_000716 [Monosporascus sp. CRB-9-2]|nr:hypothetical protein DL770_000716 [Monosporascus sp. CRB-9-2]